MDSQIPGNCSDDQFVTATKVNVESFSMYPNPATNLVTIKLNPGDQVIVYNNYGQKIYCTIMEDESKQVNLESFKSGVYFISCKGESMTVTKKLLIMK